MKEISNFPFMTLRLLNFFPAKLESEVMDVYFTIRRKKTTIFADVKEDSSVHELKKIVEGILKVPPTNQLLYNEDNVVMHDFKKVAEYGFTPSTGKAENPAPIGLALRQENGIFESLEITPYTKYNDPPEVLKCYKYNRRQC